MVGYKGATFLQMDSSFHSMICVQYTVCSPSFAVLIKWCCMDMVIMTKPPHIKLQQRLTKALGAAAGHKGMPWVGSRA